MSKNTIRWAIVIVALAVVAWLRLVPHDGGARSVRHITGGTLPATRTLGSLAFKPCTLAPQLGAAGVEAQCGSLNVAENPAAPQSRRITLNIAWIPADDSGDHAPDPVFMIAGGPGQSASESYPQVAPAFREVLKHRGVVLVDQRGTGKSNPLTCAPEDQDDAAMGADEAAATAAMRGAATRCRDALSTRADLRFYTTSEAIADLDAVRTAIGANTINLIGISYGTRVAQHYARRYPTHTRSIVLDSVAPNTIYLGNDFARNLESALDLQFGRCGETPACAKALGNPRDRLDTLMARLKADPPRVDYRDAGTGEQRQDTLYPGNVIALARMYAYAPLAASILPLQLNEGAQGRYAGLMALSKMLVGDLDGMMAMGMQLSVICSEDAAGLKDDPAMATSLLGNVLVSGLRAQCAVWPKGRMPADFHQPLRTNVPALLLSGELDPVTPPAYAQAVVRSLPQGRALVLRGQGHNVIGAGCMPKLFAQFLDTANARTLDAKCLDTLTGTPPFTTFNGWTP